jgi:hypothetical protein
VSTVLSQREVDTCVARRPPVSAATVVTVNTIVLLTVALVLRVWRLGSVPGINGDEAWSGVEALKLLSGAGIEWQTPTGNPINWFFLLPMTALHAIWPPSFVLLRITPLVSGVAALVANYLLCCKAFDRRTASVSTLILALMPINIAYSRFAWDASQSLLATAFVMYLPLIQCRAKKAVTWPNIWAMAALGAAVLVHPTNVFAVMLIVAGPVWFSRDRIIHTLRLTTVSARPGMFAALGIMAACTAFGIWTCLSRGFPRLPGPWELDSFALNYWHLLSGTTAYDFISGAGASKSIAPWSLYTVAATDASFAILALIGLTGIYRRLTSSPPINDFLTADVVLVVGWLSMLAAFFVVAGPRAIAPHFERYGICLVAPAALVISRGLVWWIGQGRLTNWSTVVAMSIAAWLWPASFYLNYFEYFRETGGTSHVAFRTAEVEPKQAALDFVLSHCNTERPVRMVCSQWWSYWPVRYLAFDSSARLAGVARRGSVRARPCARKHVVCRICRQVVRAAGSDPRRERGDYFSARNDFGRWRAAFDCSDWAAGKTFAK